MARVASRPQALLHRTSSARTRDGPALSCLARCGSGRRDRDSFQPGAIRPGAPQAVSTVGRTHGQEGGACGVAELLLPRLSTARVDPGVQPRAWPWRAAVRMPAGLRLGLGAGPSLGRLRRCLLAPGPGKPQCSVPGGGAGRCKHIGGALSAGEASADCVVVTEPGWAGQGRGTAAGGSASLPGPPRRGRPGARGAGQRPRAALPSLGALHVAPPCMAGTSILSVTPSPPPDDARGLLCCSIQPSSTSDDKVQLVALLAHTPISAAGVIASWLQACRSVTFVGFHFSFLTAEAGRLPTYSSFFFSDSVLLPTGPAA